MDEFIAFLTILGKKVNASEEEKSDLVSGLVAEFVERVILRLVAMPQYQSLQSIYVEESANYNHPDDILKLVDKIASQVNESDKLEVFASIGEELVDETLDKLMEEGYLSDGDMATLAEDVVGLLSSRQAAATVANKNLSAEDSLKQFLNK